MCCLSTESSTESEMVLILVLSEGYDRVMGNGGSLGGEGKGTKVDREYRFVHYAL